MKCILNFGCISECGDLFIYILKCHSCIDHIMWQFASYIEKSVVNEKIS